MRADAVGRVATGLVLGALVLGASQVTPAPAATVPATATAAGPLEPYAIFENARKAWGVGAYPRYAEYTAVVAYHNGDRYVRRTWETTEDIRHGVVFSHAFSREERAHPYTPHGINVNIPFAGNLNRVVPSDPIGQVAFAIDQDFGLAPSERILTSSSTLDAIEKQRSALPLIGRTGTVARRYEVRLIETLTDEQGPEYHLGLRPLVDPGHNRLRELWIDGHTWRTEEAVVDGIGNRAPLTRVPWRIEYRQTSGATYIARESALAPLDYGSDGMLSGVTVAFDEVRLESVLRTFGFGGDPGARPLGEP